MSHHHHHHRGPGHALRHGLREIERDARHAARHARHAHRHGHMTTGEEVGIGVLAGAALGAGVMAAAASGGSSSRTTAPRGDSAYASTTVYPAGGSGYYGNQPVGTSAYMGAAAAASRADQLAYEERQRTLAAQQRAEEERVKSQQAELARQQEQLAEERRKFEAKQKELALQKEREELDKQKREFEEMQMKMAMEQSKKEAEKAEAAKVAAEAAAVATAAAVVATEAAATADTSGSAYYGGPSPAATQSTITSTADVAIDPSMAAPSTSSPLFGTGGNPYYSGAAHPASATSVSESAPAVAAGVGSSASFAGYPTLGKPVGPAPVPPSGPQLARAPASEFQPRADCRGTIKVMHPYTPAKAMEDALDLRRAMKGLGSDKRAIVRITGTRSLAQRLMIKEAYKRVDGEGKKERSLLKDFNGELSGNFKKTVLLCYASPGSPDAKWFKEAMDGRGYDTSLLTEILCTRTNGELKQAIEAWKQVNPHTKGLKKRLSEETKKMFSSGNFHEFCTALLDLKRPMLSHAGGPGGSAMGASAMSLGGSVDRVKAKADAEMLNRKVSGTKSDAKAAFVEIFTTRPWQQIAAISEEFQAISKKRTLDSSIHKFFGDSDTAVGLRSVLKFSSAPYAYWAERLQKSMKGLGTDDSELRRIIISRCEIDLANISEEFSAHYGKGKTLKSWIDDDTSGDYSSLLKLLCGFD